MTAAQPASMRSRHDSNSAPRPVVRVGYLERGARLGPPRGVGEEKLQSRWMWLVHRSALQPAEMPPVHRQYEITLVEPVGLELACPVVLRRIPAPLEGIKSASVPSKADVGGNAGAVDGESGAEPEQGGFVFKDDLGHWRAADVAGTDETDPVSHRAIVASTLAGR